MHPVELLGRVDIQFADRPGEVVYAIGLFVKTVILGNIADPDQFLGEDRPAVRLLEPAENSE